MPRPESLFEIASRINADVERGTDAYQAMSYHVSDYRHSVPGCELEWLVRSIAEEPPRVIPVIDVWLAGLAEYLARNRGVPPPAWTEEPCRFLAEPFQMCNRKMWEAGLVPTPNEWLRRNLICEAPSEALR
jgi:hypothetical protein